MASWSIISVSDTNKAGRIDPEYFKPRNLAALKVLKSLKCQEVKDIASVTDGIHSSPDLVEDSGITYLSAKCIRNNDFVLGDTLLISRTQHIANPRTSLRAGDVLITTVGTIGNTAVVQEDFLPANADRHLGIIRLKTDAPFDAYYLAAFLNSRYGKLQSLREATGNVQLNLFIEKIKILQIPVLACVQSVSNAVKDAYASRREAMRLVTQSDSLADSVLLYKTLDTSVQKTYETTLLRVQKSGRLNAEFYMPLKQRIVESLSHKSWKPLSFFVDSIRVMWSPTTSPQEMVRNFDVTHALEPFLDDRVVPTKGYQIGSVKKTMKPGDVVISRLRSYLKQIAIVKCSTDVPIVGSSEFFVLRPKGGLTSEALLALLRSSIIQSILKWSQDGTNHPRFCEKALLAIPVPEAFLKSQTSLKAMVEEAVQARQALGGHLARASMMIEHEVSLSA